MTTVTDGDYDYVRQLLQKHSAIVLDENKSYLIDARLSPLATDHGFDSVPKMLQELRTKSYGSLHKSVVEALTTNETSFFRDLAPFEALEKTVLPDLIERRKAIRTLKIWCAACSSGQEPYSVAMAAFEAFPELEGWNLQIVATDLNTAMVERTQSGKYSQLEINRGLPAKLGLKYFKKKGLKYEAKPMLRDKIDARPMNLIDPWPPMGPFDIVFMRNVLIYFGTEHKRLIFDRMLRVMRHDAYMFLGGAETTVGIHEGFHRLPIPKACCYRLKGNNV